MILICILNFHQHNLLMDYLLCLKKQIKCEFQIIVGDIQPNEHEYEYVEQLINDHDIYYISIDENLGYAKGNNFLIHKGVEYYGDNFDYILISNPDIIIDNPLTLFTLKDILSHKKNCSIIGPKVKKGREIQGPYKEQTIIKYIFYYLFPFISVPYRKIIFHRRKYCTDEGVVWRIIGAFMLIKYDSLKRVNYFDENTFLYWEEDILSFKLSKINQKVYYYPRIEIKHYHGGGKSTKYLSKYAIDSMRYYFTIRGYNKLLINIAIYVSKIYNAVVKIIL